MRLPAKSIAVAALCGATLRPSPARAGEPADVDLRWSAPAAPPACPDQAHVRAAVERLAGRPLRSPGGARVPVSIEVAPSERGWEVRITIEHPGDAAPRERRIHGPTCPEVADAAAVVVAVALAEGAAPPPPRVRVPIVVEPPADRPAEPPLPDGPALHPGLRLFGGADFASLPAPTFGVEVAAVLVFGANRLEARGALWLPETAETQAMASAQISLDAAGARYCRTFLQSAIELGGCAGVEVGALRGISNGVRHPASGASPWVAPGLGLLGEWAFAPHLSLALGLDGLVPVVRKSFEVAGLGQLYRPPPVTARALFGLETRFR
jgi:hypothetical protein